jgi:entericidin B
MDGNSVSRGGVCGGNTNPSMKSTRLTPTPSRTTVLALFSLVLGALAFSGCQTMEGAGKDIERAGEKIQENAKD